MRRFIGVLLLLGIIAATAAVKILVIDHAADYGLTDRALSDKAQAFIDPDLQALMKDKVQLEREQIATKRSEEHAKQANIAGRVEMLPFWRNITKYSVVGVVSAFILSIVTVATALALTAAKRGNIHVAEIAGDKIPVHYKDIRNMQPVLMGLTTAKIQASLAGREGEAFEMARGVLQDMAIVTRSMVGRRGLQAANIDEIQQAYTPAALPQSTSIPAFRDILQTLEPGEDMILGYNAESFEPITGTFDRIYSCGIFGLSGSGKTTGLYSIICQSLLTFPDIRYFVIDPHKSRPEGLTAGLPKTQHFTHLDPNDYRQGLYLYNQALTRRLESQKDYKNAPLVLLIDELPIVMRSAQSASIEALLGRIAAEGRKVGCYCLIAGQDTRLKAAGNNRDLLCSQIAYNLKKKQARYLFDDSDLVELHKTVREAKEKGLCVFAPTDGDALIVKQPYCKPEDVKYVETLVLKQANGQDVVITPNRSAAPSQKVNVDKGVDAVETPVATDVDRDMTAPASDNVIERIATFQRENGLSLGELSRRAGIDKGLLSKVFNGKIEASDSVIEKLKTLLTTDDSTPSNVIPFRQKQEA